jgi:copper resistance protein C
MGVLLAAKLPAGQRRPLAVTVPLALLLLVALAGTALGHVALEASDPPDGATIDTPPVAVTLTFTEALDPGRSNFALVGPGGPMGSGAVSPADPRQLVLDTPNLQPGNYEVRWAAAGGDVHLERGIVRFTLVEPTPSPSPTSSPAPTATAAATPAPATPAPVATPDPPTPGPTDPAGSPGGDILLPIVAALVLVVLMGAFLLRRTRAG